MKRLKISTEFDRIMEKIEDGENFSLSRIGPGEMTIFSGEKVGPVTDSDCYIFDPENELHSQFRKLLIESIVDNADGYIRGIPDYCSYHEFFVDNVLGLIKNKENITLSNIFVNNNMHRLNEVVDTLTGKNIIITCDWRAAAIQNPHFPLNVRYCFRTKGNCIDNLGLLNEIMSFISENEIENYIFLFFSGPLSNVLAHQLYKFNPNNTYIDMGAIFDPIFYGFSTRSYHNPNDAECNKINILDLVEDDSEVI